MHLVNLHINTGKEQVKSFRCEINYMKLYDIQMHTD